MFLLIRTIAESIIRLLEFLLFARAVFSWFPQMQGSKLAEFLYVVTEPLILPFRNLLNRFDAIRMMPIDISFLCAFLALEIILALL
ncbi:MAG: YggT family protein [Intestinibacillus sp.]